MSIRTVHAYVGIFIAPSVLLFCSSGALQIFSLHEAHGSYKPPAFVEKLAMLHKDQVFELKAHDEVHESTPEGDRSVDSPEESPKVQTVVLKYFFLFVAIALATSTFLGLWLGLTHVRHKRIGWLLLALGASIPAALALV